MKKSFLFTLLFVLILLSTSVLALRVSYDSIQEEVLPVQSSSYTIHLINDDNEDYTVTIKSIDLAWQMDKDSTNHEVKAGQTKDVEVVFQPLSANPKPGIYGINFQAVTSRTKETKLLPVTV